MDILLLLLVCLLTCSGQMLQKQAVVSWQRRPCNHWQKLRSPWLIASVVALGCGMLLWIYLLQRLRDEAHRFAITFHRQRRSKAMTASVLDDVPGLGEARRKALLRTFGSVKKLRAASVEEIQAVPGIGPTLAAAVLTALAAPDEAAPAVNLTTGEVL